MNINYSGSNLFYKCFAGAGKAQMQFSLFTFHISVYFLTVNLLFHKKIDLNFTRFMVNGVFFCAIKLKGFPRPVACGA